MSKKLKAPAAFGGKGVAAAILAGGKSVRMGQPKALLLYNDKPLIEHLIDRLKTNVQQLFIVGCPEPGLYRNVSARVIPDESEALGPLGGMLSALHYVNEDIAYLLIVPCDGIALPRLFVSRMVRALERQQADVVYARDASREQHLYCLLKVELEASLREYIKPGGRKVIDWFHLQHYAVEDFSADHFVFSNLNTLDDWQQFLSESH